MTGHSIATTPRAVLAALLLLLITAGAEVRAQAAEPVEAEPTPTVLENPALTSTFGETITANDLAAHLYIFASDYFEGRETATRGQKLAANYLASQYKRIGLTPMGTVQTDDPNDLRRFFQPMQVYSNRLSSSGLEARVDGETIASTTFGPNDFDGSSYHLFGTVPEATGSVVFAGYGISDAESGYDDYAALADQDVSIDGSWLVMLAREPMGADERSLLTEDGELSDWSESLWTKFRAATAAGQMRGIILVEGVGPGSQNTAQKVRQAADALQTRVGSISLDQTSQRRSFPPVHVVSAEFANQLLAPSGRRVEDLQQQITAGLEPVVFAVEDVELTSTLEYETVSLETENVIAVVEGSDPALRDEYVIITSHYDHVGVDPTLEGDQIFNGADDDGSGTVALLEIAEAFQHAKDEGRGPRRSVMFMNVTAEEKGLLGSRYYSDIEPVVPLENTVANLNIDMIGRHDPTYPGATTDYVYIIGSDLISEDIHQANAQVNEVLETGIELSDRFNSPDDPNQFFRRSDHWNFGKHNIPFIFFFTGTHEDYHGVGDHADKIDYPRMERISRLVFGTAWQLANQDERPAVSGTGFN